MNSHRPRSQNIPKESTLNPEKDSSIKRPRSHISSEKSSQNYKPLENWALYIRTNFVCVLQGIYQNSDSERLQTQCFKSVWLTVALHEGEKRANYFFIKGTISTVKVYFCMYDIKNHRRIDKSLISSAKNLPSRETMFFVWEYESWRRKAF